MKKQFFPTLINSILTGIAIAVIFSSCAGGLSKRESARVYYNLGNAYFELGKNEDASAAYLRALDFDSELKVATYNLVRTYIEAEKYSEALRLLDRMIENDNENTVLHSAKGYCLFRFGNYNKAAESYLDVIKINPGDQDALFNYAFIMTELGNYESAVEKLAELKSANPDDDLLAVKIDFAIGRIYYLQEDYKKSQEYFESVYEKNPDYGETAAYLFEIYKNSKLYGKMVETGKKILENEPDNGDILFDLSRVLLLEIEDSEQGLEFFKKAIKSGFSDKEMLDELLENKNNSVKKEIEKILENSD